jgi:hypothetical protein
MNANDSSAARGQGYRTDLDLVFCRPGGSPEDPNVVGRRFTRQVRDLPLQAGFQVFGPKLVRLPWVRSRTLDIHSFLEQQRRVGVT